MTKNIPVAAALVKYLCTGSGTTGTTLPVLHTSRLDVFGLGLFGTGGKIVGLFCL